MKFPILLALSLYACCARAETFTGPTTATNRLIVPTNSAIIITATFGDFTNSTQVSLGNSVAFTQSYFAPLENGTTYALAGPAELIFSNAVVFTFFRLTNSTISTASIGYDPFGIAIASNKTMHIFGVPAPVNAGFERPDSGAVNFKLEPNQPAEFTGPGTLFLNSGVFPPLGKFISYFIAEDGFAVPGQRAIVGPTGSFSIVVEKSADLSGWSPVMLENTSDASHAYYRLSIQR